VETSDTLTVIGTPSIQGPSEPQTGVLSVIEWSSSKVCYRRPSLCRTLSSFLVPFLLQPPYTVYVLSSDVCPLLQCLLQLVIPNVCGHALFVANVQVLDIHGR
jgi:hypothetical protein